MGFLPWEIQVAFPRERQLQQCRPTQPSVHAECFSVSIIHRTLTWATGSLTCAQMLMHAIAHGGVRTHVKESALKVDSGRKLSCHIKEMNLRQQRAGPTLYQLSYIPPPPFRKAYQHCHLIGCSQNIEVRAKKFLDIASALV